MSASSPTAASTNPVVKYFQDFKVLKETPREYWGVQVLNFIDSTMYFALLIVVSIFLSDEIGLNDKDAGYVITGFTSATTVLLLFAGLFTDSLGIKKSFRIAFAMRAVLSVAIAAVAWLPGLPARGWIEAVLFLLMAPSMAMAQTAFQSANKRFTSTKSRSAGFSLWYLFMNIGAFAAGLLVDLFGLVLNLSTTWIMASGGVAYLVSMFVAFAMIKDETQYKGRSGDDAADDEPAAEPERKKPMEILKAMVSESAFWRFVVLISLLLGVRAVFSYMYLLMPKYWTRVIGEDAAIGTLNAINPFLIVIGIILIVPIANKFNIFKMLVYGSMISALSLFALLIPWQWLGSDFEVSYYTMSFIAMVMLSIGEVIWSPKLSEYTAAIAPEGQEGSYLGMSMMPWFAAKTIVSLLSGHMLTRWVPEGIGERMREGTVPFWDSPEAMWLILGIVAITGPLIALLLQKWLTKGARWKTDDHDEAAA